MVEREPRFQKQIAGETVVKVSGETQWQQFISDDYAVRQARESYEIILATGDTPIAPRTSPAFPIRPSLSLSLSCLPVPRSRLVLIDFASVFRFKNKKIIVGPLTRLRII